MTREAMEAVIALAIQDEGFRTLLLSEPDQAVSDYDLSGEEIARLKAVPAGAWATLDDPEGFWRQEGHWRFE